jgi:hypothetical protein
VKTEFDPRVATVLDRLVPELDSNPEAMLRAASARARVLTAAHAQRRRRILIVSVAVLALIVGGGALAASQFDVLPWLSHDNPSEATFSIDRTRHYDGPAPDVLVCPGAGSGDFTCSEGTLPPRGARTYLFAERVEDVPQVTRTFMLLTLARDERRGRLSADEAARVRRDVDAVDDSFFRAISLFASVRTNGGGEQAPGRPGFELVPPAGVPEWISCRSLEGAFTCRPIARSRDVPVGAPAYMLERSDEWTAQPREASTPPDVRALFHAVLGRDLEPAEIRLFIDLLTVGEAEGGGVEEGPIRVVP